MIYVMQTFVCLYIKELTKVLAQNLDMYYALLLYDKIVCKLCKLLMAGEC